LSSVTFSGNSADTDIANSGVVTIKGEGVSLEKGITGTGNTTIADGAELVNGESSKIIQSSITVAGKLINNNTNTNVIVATDKIGVENTGSMNINASAVSALNGIENEGTVTFTGGTNENKIAGTGELDVTGEVINNANIAQEILAITGKLTNNEGNKIAANKVTNSGTLTSKAEDIETSRINNAGGTYNITGGKVGYNVTGASDNKGTINIRNNEVTIANGVKYNDVNLATTLNLSDESYLDDSTLSIENGATLDIRNEAIGTVQSVKITEATWNLKLDVNIDTLTADQLNVVDVVANSNALITDIGFIGTNNNLKANNTIQITEKSINATTNPDIYSIGDINYQITATNGAGGTYLNLVAFGYGGLANAIYDEETSYDVVENDTVTSWINGKNNITENLVINGRGNTLTATPESGTLEGIVVDSGKKLTVKDLASFEGFNRAITVNDG
jgi:hypothetical protein